MPTPPSLPESAANLAHLRHLATLRDQAQHRALTDEEQAELADHEAPCVHCGGYHVRACPRVRRVVFRQNGSGVQEVEYWPASEIDWTGVIFEDAAGESGDDQDGMMLVPGDLVRRLVRNASSSDTLKAMDQLRRSYDMWLEETELSTLQSGHGPAPG